MPIARLPLSVHHQLTDHTMRVVERALGIWQAQTSVVFDAAAAIAQLECICRHCYPERDCSMIEAYQRAAVGTECDLWKKSAECDLRNAIYGMQSAECNLREELSAS